MAILNRPCKLAAISWRLVATKFRTCSNFEAIYWRFFQFESNKNLLWCTPEGSLSQTWRTLLVTRPQKSRQKKEKAPKEARKLAVVLGVSLEIFKQTMKCTVCLPCRNPRLNPDFSHSTFFFAATKNNCANS